MRILDLVFVELVSSGMRLGHAAAFPHGQRGLFGRAAPDDRVLIMSNFVLEFVELMDRPCGILWGGNEDKITRLEQQLQGASAGSDGGVGSGLP